MLHIERFTNQHCLYIYCVFYSSCWCVQYEK